MNKSMGLAIAQLAWAVVLAFTLDGAPAAQASFVTTTDPPDLFPAGSFITGGPSVCISSGPLTGVCTSHEKTTIDASTVTFPDDGNENIVLDGVVTGDTTNPAGSFALGGTEDMTIVGRSNAFQTGTFVVDVTSENFTGDFFGHTVELSLDPAGVHNGQITITQLVTKSAFLIDTSLVISHEISVDSGAPVQIGTAHATVAVSEPAGLAVLALPLFVLLSARRNDG